MAVAAVAAAPALAGSAYAQVGGGPAIVDVSSPDDDGAYGTGKIVVVSIVFNAAVDVAGAPTLALATDPPRNATYAGGGGSTDLEFWYTVRPGDDAARLDYAGTGALMLNGGSITGSVGGMAADTMLPEPGSSGSLGASKSIAVVGGPLPILRAADSAVHGEENYDLLAGAQGIDTLEAVDDDGGAHALVAARGIGPGVPYIGFGLQLVRVHPNGTLSAGGSIVTQDISSPLAYSTSVTAFEMGDRGRSLVSAGITGITNRGHVSLVDMYPNGTIALNSSAGDGERGFVELEEADGASVFRADDGQFHALVSAKGDDGLQLLRILPNGTLVHNGSAANGIGGLELSAPDDVDMLGADGRGASGNRGPPRAIVATFDPGGLQLVSVHPNGTISHNGSATNGTGGFETLGSASGVAAFEMGGLDYAVATSEADDGIQLVRIHPNGTLAAADSATNGTGGFDALGQPEDVDVFRMGGWTYALATSWTDDGLQLVRIHPNGILAAAGSATDGTGGFVLGSPIAVDVFRMGGRTYAMAAAQGDNAVQLVRLSPASVANVSLSADDNSGPHTAGFMINITVAFDEPVVLQDPQRPTSILLSFDGAADNNDMTAAPYLDGSGTNKLVFNYTVRPGDTATPVLEYAHAGALASRGAITDMRGDPVDLELPEPGTDGSIGARGVRIDAQPPQALGASFLNESGTYIAGSAIHIAVEFSESVTVSGGPPLLALSTSPPANATYASGSGTDELVFVYTVRDDADPLAYAGRDALNLNGSRIYDAAGNNALLSLPDPDPLGPSGIAVDGIAPSAVSAYPLNGTDAYMAEERIAINVTFSEPVVVTGVPFLELGLDGDGATGQAGYDSGNGSAMLTFVYAVRDNDNAANLDYTGTSALMLNGGTIKDKAGNDAVLTTLPDPAGDGLIGPLMPIKIDTIDPTVSTVLSLNGTNTYGIDKRIAVNITFSEPVVVAGVPTLAMETGETDRQALYVAGSNTSALTFVYQVQPGDAATDLDYNGTGALALAGGSTIRDAAGNDADLTTLPDPGDDGLLDRNGDPITITIDGEGAGVQYVTSDTDDGAYMAGEVINVQVVFSESVFVGSTGRPTLAMETGDTDRLARYSEGNTSDTLTFLYTVQDGDNSADLDYNGTGALAFNGSTIRDVGGNNATLILPSHGSPESLAGQKDIAVDTIDPRALSALPLNASDAYMAEERIAINVTFSEPVVVTGEPFLELGLDGNGATARAGYDSGNGSAMLTFVYAVQDNDNAANLDYTSTNALMLNGGTITDVAGNDAVLTTLPDPAGDGLIGPLMPIVIDTTKPVVSTVLSLNGTDMYGIGKRIAVSVTFDETVLVDGMPVLYMETGDTDRQAMYVAGHNTSALTFVYHVRPGDNATDLDYNGTDALALAGGSTIRDTAGNSANRTLPEPGNDGLLDRNGDPITITIDGTGAGVLRVTSDTDDGAYMAGEMIDIKVVFSESVFVGSTGRPTLAMETGDTDRLARYSEGNTSDTLTFLYTVQDGDNSADLDYNGTGALALNGSTIKDTIDNDAIRTLLPPGDPDSLAGRKDIAVDTIDPRALSALPLNASGAYMAEERIAINVTFSEPVVVTGVPFLDLGLDDNGATARALYNSGNGSAMLTFVYAVQDNDNAANLDYTDSNALMLDGGTITDVAGNDAVLTTLPDPAGDGLIGPLMPIKIDTINPTVSTVLSLNGTDTYGIGKRIAVSVTFDETVLVDGIPVLYMETGDTDRQARYVAGNDSETLTFVYQVRPGDNATDLDYNGIGALALAGGSTILDTAGNSANRTLPEPGNDGLLDGAENRIVIDGTGAGVLRVTSDTDDGAYMAGEVINVQVVFSENVFVGSTGRPTLAMETGDTDRLARYSEGNTSDTLTFLYTVQDGDNSADLDYNGTGALAFNGSTIRDAGGNNATLTLPNPVDPDRSLADLKDIVVDTIDPRALSALSLNGTDAYMAEERIAVNVTFDETVVVTGVPTLAMETGDTDRQADYTAGNGSDRLTFVYTVQPGDISADLDYANASALTPGNGGAIADYAGNSANLTLPAPGDDGLLGPSMPIEIDTIDPTVESVSSLNGTDTYGIGERIAVSVTFDETVLVDGMPVLYMETGDTDRQAMYVAGHNTSALTFVYQVQPSDTATDLDYNGTDALALAGGSTIRDTAGNSANLTLPAPGDDGLLAGPNPITIDTGGEPTPPASENATVLSAVFTARNTATITYSGDLDRPESHEGDVYESVAIEGGDTVRIAPENVTGLGSATHRIAFGGAGVDRGQEGTISLASELVGTASGGALLRFAEQTIRVAPGETVRVVEQDEPRLPGAPPPPPVAIERDGFTRTVNATGAGSGTRMAINVTGLAPLPPPGAAPPANATTVEFPAEPVTMIAVFAEVMFPANATASSVPAGGLIVLYETDAVPLTGDIAAALGIADAGSLRVRQLVEIGDNQTHIAFDRPVRILLPGQAGGSAFYVNNTDDAVVPIDTQCTGDSPEAAAAAQLGGAGECWIDVPGAAGDSKVIYTYHLTRFGIAEAADSQPPPAVDAPEPASVSVLQRPGGEPLRVSASYVEGQSIIVAVDFSAPVTVDTTGGTPRLLLETGSAGAAAPYASGSGTDRLEFAYAVRGGDITGRLSYAGTGALELGGGSISAAGSAATAASIALPPPGGPGSLSAPGSPGVRIDPIGRPVLGVGILDEGGAGAGHVSRAAYIAAAEFNERQGSTDGALLINATSYDAGGGSADAAAAALRSAHSSAGGGGAGPYVYVGPSTDRGLHAAMPYAANNDIVLVSAGSTAPSLAVAGDRTFRLLPSDRLEAEALARLAYSGGDELVHAVLDNATYGPSYGSGARGGLANADLPPPQGAFAHAFGAALASAAISPLSGTVTLAGGAGVPYEGAAAAAALDASVQAASASGARPTSVIYLGSPEGLAALAGSSASYPALSSASWFASGLSAGSGLLAGDGSAAAGFAASSGLSAARWSPPASTAGQAIDSRLPGMGPGERNSAYAAYDAVIVVGQAAVAAAAELGSSGDVPDAAAIADALPAAAAAHDGALGDIALDSAGDLWVPAVYDLWTVSRQGGAGTIAEWSRQQGELDGERACSITLTRAKIDYGPIDSGQTSRPHLQTIVNTGQLPFAQVDLTATPWHVDSPGNCEAGVEPSLPVGLSEVRTVQGGAFSDLVGTGTTLAEGLEAGSRAPLWYRLSLAGYADLPQAEITQCATYVVRCS